jgi:hypothetical protein
MNLRRLLYCLLAHAVIAAAVSAAGNTGPIYQKLRDIKLSGDIVTVKNLVLKRDIATFSFKEGTFYLLETVEDRITGAVFIGDGEFSMIPVLNVEKHHLSHLTGGPSITEKFSKMIIRFTDLTDEEIAAAGVATRTSSTNNAAAYLGKIQKLLRKGRDYASPNIAVSLLKYNLDIRLLADILRPGHGEFFHAVFNGKKYGDMFFIFDPLGARSVEPEEVLLACLGEKNLGIWVAEHREKFYTGNNPPDIDHRLMDMEHFNISATTRRNHLDAAVTLRFTALADGVRVIPFYLFPKLRMVEVTDSISGNLSFIQERDDEDGDFAVILPDGLKKGEQYSITFDYAGDNAVVDEGGGNFTLVARSTWYPVAAFGDRATFRMSLRTPTGFEVVATGQPTGREVRGDTLITRWKSDVPLITAGFNYGQFKKSVTQNNKLNITIESYANVNVPDKIKEFQLMLERYEHSTGQISPLNLGTIDTVRLMDKIRAEAQVGISLYWKMFGPMPFDRVAISQQPFPDFGQAWPMLVYMPIIAYLNSSQLNELNLIPALGFIKNACAHEVAHQWWGHTVGYKSYRSMWLSESLAQLSASLFTRAVYKNAKFIEYWKDLRKRALKKNRKRKCPSKIGSITLGYRLDTGRTGDVSSAAIYARGAFVTHMLRMMMWNSKRGDKRFSDMLKDFVKTYYLRDASTEDFKQMVEKHMTTEMDLDGNGKMDWFFDQWVYGTSVPRYEMVYRIKPAENGKFSLSCRITQREVDDFFKMRVPVYAVFEDNRLFRLGAVVLTGRSTTPEITFILPGKPKQVLLCAMEDVLCTYSVKAKR